MDDATAFCSAADLDAELSAAGVDLYATDDQVGGAGPEAAVRQAIGRATADITYYCQQYSPASLAENPWARSKCLTLALWYLCGRRNNPRPAELVEEYEEAKEQLVRVLEGKARVPGAALGKGFAPTIGHQRVDLRRYPGVVVEGRRSTGRAEGYVRHLDRPADGLYGG